MSEGTIITFYSYKGGVGRTFALANIAALLSTWGYKVLCIDWDLEAPGLQFYFQSRMKDQNSPGLVEFIQAHIDGQQPRWQEYTTPVSFNHTDTPLLFMQAGRQDESYAQRMQALNWDNLYAEYDLGNFLEQLRNDWKQSLDFIFIDSRTGITDIGGICTIQLPDLLVVPLTANEQSLSGSIETLKRLQAAQADLPLDHGNILVLPVISRFERRVEYELAERWLAKFAERLAPFYKEWLHRDVNIEELLNFTRIPSIPFWSFGEELPVIEKGTEDPEDIGFSLETLAALVAQKFAFTDVLVQNRDAFVNTARASIKIQKNLIELEPSLDEQIQGTSPINIFISYAHEDMHLEEELELHLAPLRRWDAIQLWSDRKILLGEDRKQEFNSKLKEADIILLLISSNYLASSLYEDEMMLSLARANAGEAIVIPIILRHVYWQSSPINGFNVLPRSAQPVTIWANRDEVWLDVVLGIHEAAKSLKKT